MCMLLLFAITTNKFWPRVTKVHGTINLKTNETQAGASRLKIAGVRERQV